MSSPKSDHDMIFPAFTLSQAKDGIFELYDAWKPGGGSVPIAHQVNDVTGVLHYAGSVAAPDDDHHDSPMTAGDDPKAAFVAMVAPLAEAKTAGERDEIAKRINWRGLAKLLIQVLPLILPLFLSEKK